jgi:hypothetical protein
MVATRARAPVNKRAREQNSAYQATATQNEIGGGPAKPAAADFFLQSFQCSVFSGRKRTVPHLH